MTARADQKTDDFAQPGAVIAGKYEVLERIGAGGMGVVVAARHLHLGQMVAIKLLHPKAALDEQTVGRFQREGRAAAALRSDHVAKTLDIGWTDGGAPYLVMEFLEGGDLGQELRKSGPLSVTDAAGYVLQACEAMAEAHRLGIVHRDLKPSNLFLATHPSGARTVKVLDFGISKLAASSDAGEQALTTTMATLGTPLYMSPEQMRSAKNVDARTDIWSLGAILYELLAGVPPFRAGSLPELCARILTEAPEPLADKRPEVPEPLARTIHACLEKDPSGRPQSVGELADVLRPFAPANLRDITITNTKGLPVLPSPLAETLDKGASTQPGAARTTGSGSPRASLAESGEGLEQTGSAASTARTLGGREPSAPARKPPWVLLGAVGLCAVAAIGLVLGRGSGAVPSGNSSAPPAAPSATHLGATATETAPVASAEPAPQPSAQAAAAASHAEPQASAQAAAAQGPKGASKAKPPGPKPAGQPNDDPTKSRQF